MLVAMMSRSAKYRSRILFFSCLQSSDRRVGTAMILTQMNLKLSSTAAMMTAAMVNAD
jgi:hypothetical protein